MDSKKANEAIGLLIGFYRRVRRLQQTALAEKVGTSNSAFAMAEAGIRSFGKSLWPITEALGLSVLARQQIEALTGISSRFPKDMVIPEDVLEGSQLFVRNFQQEFSGEHRQKIDAVWIMTKGNLLREKHLLDFLSERIGDTEFVFFVSSNCLSLQTCVTNLEDLFGEVGREKKKHVGKNLRVVKIPYAMCLQDILIYNPGKPFCMSGRIVVDLGFPFGTYAMEPLRAGDAYHLLQLILIQVESKPGIPVDAYGSKCELLVHSSE